MAGENNAALDGGEMSREFMGVTHYSFDRHGVGFIALDNVSAGGQRSVPVCVDEVRLDAVSQDRTDRGVHASPAVGLQPEWEWGQPVMATM